jgi:GH24 family phage-related lysozyme (muramidase)
MQLDPRRLQVTLEVDGKLIQLDERYSVTFTVSKSIDFVSNEADIKIYNLPVDLRNHILYKIVQFSKDYKRTPITLQVGRVSTGLHTIFIGDAITANISSPPDICLTLKCKSGHWFTREIQNATTGNLTDLSKLVSDLAKRMGLSPVFEATDKKIARYSHSGSVHSQIEKLSKAAIDTYVFQDDGVLKAINWFQNQDIKGEVKQVSEATGMIGIPVFDDNGLTVKMLIDTGFSLGGWLNINSKLNPKINGDYRIYKLVYEGANRENQWYMTASTMPLNANSVGLNSSSAAADTQANQSNGKTEYTGAMVLSGAGLAMIKKFEGFSAKPYPDHKGFSIGYGHLIKAGENYTLVDKDQAEKILREDTRWAETAVNNAINVKITQNQFDAMCSLCFNIGAGAFNSSTVVRKTNENNRGAAAAGFDLFNLASNQINKALVSRRSQEKALYLA